MTSVQSHTPIDQDEGATVDTDTDTEQEVPAGREESATQIPADGTMPRVAPRDDDGNLLSSSSSSSSTSSATSSTDVAWEAEPAEHQAFRGDNVDPAEHFSSLLEVLDRAPDQISSRAYLELVLKVAELVRNGDPSITERKLKKEWITDACSVRVRRAERHLDGGLTTALPDVTAILSVQQGTYHWQEQWQEKSTWELGWLGIDAYEVAQGIPLTNSQIAQLLEERRLEDLYRRRWVGITLHKGSPTTQALGIDNPNGLRRGQKSPAQRLETSNNGTIQLGSQKVQLAKPASKKVDSGPKPPVRVRRAMARTTCEDKTREMIFEHVPEARDDELLLRWCAYVLWTQWRDEDSGRRIIHHEILHWIGHWRYTEDSARAVLEYIAARLPIEYTDTWMAGEFSRQIIDDGLPPELWKAVKTDLRTPPSEYGKRVYILTGETVSEDEPSRMRSEIEEELAGLQGPSPTARRIQETMNELPSNSFCRFDDKMDEAFEYVRRMEIDVTISSKRKAALRGMSGCWKDGGELKGNVARYRARLRYEKREEAEEQREEYFQILQDTAKQPKPYYNFSSKGRTDRIFSYNNSALLLPSEVREILCEGLYDVDFKSAHLMIAAWLWDAEEALERLTQDGYDVWDDLMEHLRPLFEENDLDVPDKGDHLYEEVKGGLKIMLYSIVYGMPAPSMQGEVTKALKPVLGPTVGEKLRAHPVIGELLEKRDEKLREMEPGDVLEGPTGITIEVEKELGEEDEDGEDRVGPKTAMACIAQSYEQELMSVLLDVAEDRPRFQPMLWLHDGAACKARYLNALKTDLEEALMEKREELTEFAGRDTLIPAELEIEEIEAPELPPEDVHDRIATAGGGALRLKEGETAVKVDPETGEELGPADGQTLLRREHALYKIGSTYIRITDDDYTIESDPFPEDKLWQPVNDPMTRVAKNQINRRAPRRRRTPSTTITSQPKRAPGAESLSREASSVASATSTAGASPASREDTPDSNENPSHTPNPATAQTEGGPSTQTEGPGGNEGGPGADEGDPPAQRGGSQQEEGWAEHLEASTMPTL